VQLRKRAIELQQKLDQLRLTFEANAAAFGFEALLAEFAIVNSQFAQLQSEIRPQLQHYVGHPQGITDANRDCAHLDRLIRCHSLLCTRALGDVVSLIAMDPNGWSHRHGDECNATCLVCSRSCSLK
jgi:hypothetical protein